MTDHELSISRDGSKRPRFPGWLRWVLAGPVALFLAILLMAASATVIPPGPAQVDNIGFPIMLFPLFWGAVFFYFVLEEKAWRASLSGIVLLAVTSAAITSQFTG